MDFDLSEEQLALSEAARRLIVEQSPAARLRKLWDQSPAIDRTLWSALGELGYLGLAIDPAHNGLGLSELDLALVAEEIGRGAAAVPFLSSVGLAAACVEAAGHAAQKADLLPGLADGTIIAAVAYTVGDDDVWSGSTAALPDYSGGKVSGLMWPVADLDSASIAIVACAQDGEPALAIVELGQAGVTCTPLQSIDPLRPVGELQLDAASAVLLDAADVRTVVERLLDRAATLVAFEQVGGAEACLHMALAYAAQRKIFGRSLASYQAIKHKLADVYVAVELARSNAYRAAWALSTNAPERAEAAAAARLSALEAYEMAARENVQVHGGMGYTLEADCHFHYRRERFLGSMLGGRGRWTRRLIRALRTDPLQQAA